MVTEAATMSWLERLERQLNIDVDWMDPDYVQSMPQKLLVKPHDQTSNQLWVDIELSKESNRPLLEKAARELRGEGWLAIYTRASVQLTLPNLPHIHSRVLLQTLPSFAYSAADTLAHARLYAAEFERAGVPKERYCLKIPATGPALVAAREIGEEGVATLGTALFGLPQAVACSQAGCLYVSPYFNELRAHSDRALWPNVDDPATQHPMSARLVQILDTYRKLYRETGKEQPLMKLASFLSAKEVMAAGEMGVHSATISHTLLDELAALPYDGTSQPGLGVPKPAHVYMESSTPERLKKLSSIDPLVAAEWDRNLARTDVDYLADGGSELERAVQVDPVTRQRLKDALEAFVAAEEKSKKLIEAVLASL